MMKREYKKPMAKLVDFNYDTQVTATSVVWCDQGWTRMTTAKPQMRTTFCAKCESDLIWINQVSWE